MNQSEVSALPKRKSLIDTNVNYNSQKSLWILIAKQMELKEKKIVIIFKNGSSPFRMAEFQSHWTRLENDFLHCSTQNGFLQFSCMQSRVNIVLYCIVFAMYILQITQVILVIRLNKTHEQLYF